MMQLSILVTPLLSRLALALALFSYCASAAPHLHPQALKRCNTVLKTEPCYAATDCCAFSFCQAEVQGDGSLLGVSDTPDYEVTMLMSNNLQVCMPSFSETPFMEILSVTQL